MKIIFTYLLFLISFYSSALFMAKSFKKTNQPCPLFFFCTGQSLFKLHLYPVLQAFLCHTRIYTALESIKQSWNAMWLIPSLTCSLTCYSPPWPFMSLLFYGAVCVALALVFRFVYYMKIYLDLTSGFFDLPKVFSPMTQPTIAFIPISSELLGFILCCLVCLVVFVSKPFP